MFIVRPGHVIAGKKQGITVGGIYGQDIKGGLWFAVGIVDLLEKAKGGPLTESEVDFALLNCQNYVDEILSKKDQRVRPLLDLFLSHWLPLMSKT